MSDYRRLISYIYEYEGKTKGKNVGFVKLEARNGQCRLQVNIKQMYVSGNSIGVYLLGKGEKKTLLGNMFARNGVGEFRTIVDAVNVEGTGDGMDTYYGLVVHDVKNSWRSYRTIWEDVEIVEAAEVRVEEAAEVRVEKAPEVRVEEAAEVRVEKAAEGRVREAAEVQSEESVNVQAPETATMQMAGKNGGKENDHMTESVQMAENPVLEKNDRRKNAEAGGQKEFAKMLDEIAPAKGAARADETGPTESTVLIQKTAAPEPDMTLDMALDKERPDKTEPEKTITEETFPEPTGNETSVPSAIVSPELENPEVLRYLQETEQKPSSPEALWQELRKTYPKIQPFDYDGESEVLTIRPDDIGHLPRENWIYGNNSFLMHGYYNFRYLILVRLSQPGKRSRYLLGVPGHYYSNEKYMANMFGFPNFVLSKKQPPNDGRFGYWYTDVKMN